MKPMPLESTKELKRLELAIEARAQELELFWKRSLFFWGFIGAAFIGYAQALGKSQTVAVLFASFGLVCSFAWVLANRGSKYWQENWEQKVAREERTVIDTLFGAPEKRLRKGWLSAVRFSVSRLAIAMSELTAVTWCALLAREGALTFGLLPQDVDRRLVFVIVVVGTILACFGMARSTYEPVASIKTDSADLDHQPSECRS